MLPVNTISAYHCIPHIPNLLSVNTIAYHCIPYLHNLLLVYTMSYHCIPHLPNFLPVNTMYYHCISHLGNLLPVNTMSYDCIPHLANLRPCCMDQCLMRDSAGDNILLYLLDFTISCNHVLPCLYTFTLFETSTYPMSSDSIDMVVFWLLIHHFNVMAVLWLTDIDIISMLWQSYG